jgi:hypothetical protein
MPTVPCFKGYGAGVQTGLIGGSFGGGKVDQGCDDRELARAFSGPQTIASCKILVSTKKAVAAGITLEDCLPTPVAPQMLPYGNIKKDKESVTPESSRTVTPSTFPVSSDSKVATYSCTVLNNICKRGLDEMLLRYKREGGRISVVSSPEHTRLAGSVGEYLADNGADVYVSASNDHSSLEVNVTLIN